MKYLEWGLQGQIPDNAKVGFGARGILKNGFVDIPPDRVSVEVYSNNEDDRTKFGEWYCTIAFPWMEKVAEKIHEDDPKVYILDQEIFHMRISAKGSYGYLYVSAWMDGPPFSSFEDVIRQGPEQVIGFGHGGQRQKDFEMGWNAAKNQIWTAWKKSE